ncbi:MAG: hypothetical protein Q9182_000142 [Xanthomendoza sp. 2 TL-2023]
MADAAGLAPVLSTPATHAFEADVHSTIPSPQPLRSPEQIAIRYEIERTVAEIKRGRWKRIALQFPDNMLPDAPAVFEYLSQRLAELSTIVKNSSKQLEDHSPVITETLDETTSKSSLEKLYILADTSYGTCCVDEIAAEHVNADVVVHYGKACLSPTARLPVIHVFTCQPLAMDLVIESFKSLYPDYDQSIILMSDVTYAGHLPQISTLLKDQGYVSIFTTEIVHNPSSPLPNRTVPVTVELDPTILSQWRIFHISDPSDSLLLTLSARVMSIHVFHTATERSTATAVSAAVALRRRYALLTAVSTVPVFGILINTLSVKNYLHVVEHVKSCISAAGKKSYTFVVGKINAAKVANFAEIGAWVVIGCWESSFIDSHDFWKPILTPFELELALVGDDQRVWTGEWNADFQSLLRETKRRSIGVSVGKASTHEWDPLAITHDSGETDSEPESAPPEFDLRTGRYISHSRPMQVPETIESISSHSKGHHQLVRRAKGDMATIGNHVSPGAEFLRSSRTWNGLGSDLEIEYDLPRDNIDGALIQEGRSGLARGYLSALSETRT